MHFSKACIAAAAVFFYSTLALPVNPPERRDTPSNSSVVANPFKGQNAPTEGAKPGEGFPFPPVPPNPAPEGTTNDDWQNKLPSIPQNPGADQNAPVDGSKPQQDQPTANKSLLETLLSPQGDSAGSASKPTTQKEPTSDAGDSEAPSPGAASSGRRSLNRKDSSSPIPPKVGVPSQPGTSFGIPPLPSPEKPDTEEGPGEAQGPGLEPEKGSGKEAEGEQEVNPLTLLNEAPAPAPAPASEEASEGTEGEKKN